MTWGGLERPRLADAPAVVRAAVSELLGGSIRAERAAAAGFTRSIASVVVGSRGTRSFIKAAPVGAGLGGRWRREKDCCPAYPACPDCGACNESRGYTLKWLEARLAGAGSR